MSGEEKEDDDGEERRPWPRFIAADVVVVFLVWWILMEMLFVGNEIAREHFSADSGGNGTLGSGLGCRGARGRPDQPSLKEVKPQQHLPTGQLWAGRIRNNKTPPPV